MQMIPKFDVELKLRMTTGVWILQNDINSLLTWASLNKMKFHPDKVKALHFSNSNNINSNNVFIYIYTRISANKPIEYTPCEKDLELILFLNLYGQIMQTF